MRFKFFLIIFISLLFFTVSIVQGEETLPMETVQGEGISDEQNIITLEGHTGEVTCVTFSPPWYEFTAENLETLKSTLSSILLSGPYVYSQETDVSEKNGKVPEMVLQLGHLDEITSVDFSGEYIASGSSDNTVKIWDIKTMALLVTLKGHSAGIVDLSFSPDGGYLATSDGNNLLKIWDTGNWKCVKDNLSGYYLSYSPDGKELAVTSKDEPGVINILDTETWQVANILTGHSISIISLSFINENCLVSGNEDNTLVIWDIQTGFLKPVRVNSRILSLIYSPAKNHLATVSEDNKINIRNASTWDIIKTIEGKSLAWSYDGSILATGDDSGIILWDTGSWKELKLLEGQPDISLLTFSSDGKCIGYVKTLYEVTEETIESVIEEVDTRILEPLRDKKFSLDDLKKKLEELNFNEEKIEKILANTSIKKSRALNIWFTEEMDLHEFAGHSGKVNYVSYSHDGKLCASGSREKNIITVWNLEKGMVIKTLEGFCASFSPDGKYIACITRENVKIYETEQWIYKEELEIERTSGRFGYCSYSPDGKYLALGINFADYEEGLVKIWDFEEKKVIKTLHTMITPFSFSSDGRYFLCNGIWNTSDWQAAYSVIKEEYLPGLSAYSVDDKYMAFSKYSSNNVKLLSGPEGYSELTSFNCGKGPIESLALSSDGKFITAGNEYNLIEIWNREEDIGLAIKNREIENIKEIVKKNPEMVNYKDEYGNTLFDLAVGEGDKELGLLLIQKGFEINLHMAASLGLKDQCIDLIERGADINAIDEEGNTPLLCAAAWKQREICLLLIEKGAEVNKANNGLTPLHEAAYRGLADVCLLLIEKGAEINSINSSGDMPLDLAIYFSQTETALLLIEKGAQINNVNSYGWTPLYVAASNGLTEVCLNLIEKGADINVKTTAEPLFISDEIRTLGTTPLHVAASAGYSEVCLLLIEKGADINAVDSYGYMPLHLAARTCLEEVCLKLIEKGADINASDGSGYRPLNIAIMNGLKTVCLELIEKGADINAFDGKGYKPLNLAALKDQMEILLKLIEKGADINSVNGYGSNSLHIAAANGHKEICLFLIEKGMDINGVNSFGETPLFCAASNNQTDMCLFLIEKGADINKADISGKSPLHVAAFSGYKETCLMLIEKGADIKALDNSGSTPLHSAAVNGYTEICLLLIEKGADINVKDKSGKSPLHIAASCGHSETCLLLIEKGAYNTVDDTGDTPLHSAIYWDCNEVSTLLIEQGANLSIKNYEGKRPLDMAIEKNNKEIIELLEKAAKGLLMEIEPEMIFIEGGTFEMGIDDGYDNEIPVHTVELSSFYMGKYEVTNKEYCLYNPNHSAPDNLPAVNVSWYDAVSYCNWRSEKEGLEKCYSDGDGDGLLDKVDISKNGYRLPTEAEWEYACRAGTKTKYYWGDEMDGSYCWDNYNSYNQLHPAGQKKPNPWGLYDMCGNVMEWCNDWCGDYEEGYVKNPAGPESGTFIVLRGGNFRSTEEYFRSGSRLNSGMPPEDQHEVVGFRLCRSAL